MGEEVIASASVTLVEGAMQVGGVALNLSENKGMSLAAKIGIGAGVGVAALLLALLVGLRANER